MFRTSDGISLIYSEKQAVNLKKKKDNNHTISGEYLRNGRQTPRSMSSCSMAALDLPSNCKEAGFSFSVVEAILLLMLVAVAVPFLEFWGGEAAARLETRIGDHLILIWGIEREIWERGCTFLWFLADKDGAFLQFEKTKSMEKSWERRGRERFEGEFGAGGSSWPFKSRLVRRWK